MRVCMKDSALELVYLRYSTGNFTIYIFIRIYMRARENLLVLYRCKNIIQSNELFKRIDINVTFLTVRANIMVLHLNEK